MRVIHCYLDIDKIFPTLNEMRSHFSQTVKIGNKSFKIPAYVRSALKSKFIKKRVIKNVIKIM